MSKIFGNWIVSNLLKAVILIGVIVVGVSAGLYFYTGHNKEIEVPELTMLSAEEAARVAEQSGMRVEVTDSVFVQRMAGGAVFRQNPTAGSRVKKGRLIRLSINAHIPRQVSMPNLVGYSMRQAKAELASRGLNLGKLEYVSDMATNNVLKQLYRGQEIAAGTPVRSEASIDLVVGLSDTDRETLVPNVVGMKYIRAVDAIHENSLNVVRLTFDSSVKDYADSVNAVVFRQSPEPTRTPVTMGSGVSVFLTVDPEKVPKN